jgi:hypothetical protein
VTAASQPQSGQAVACVYVRTGGAWLLQQTLAPGEGVRDESFGYHVALAGDTALVAGRPYTSATATRGAVYVFVRAGTTWRLQQTLSSSETSVDDHFGCALAVSGDRALIGARGPDDYDETETRIPGAACMFVRAGDVWTLEQTLRPDDGEAGDLFGAGVALSEETALVVSLEDVFFGGSSAYVFSRSSTGWIQQQKLTAGSSDYYQGPVALSGDTAVLVVTRDVGWGRAFRGRNFNPERAGACVYVRTGSTWRLQKTLLAGDYRLSEQRADDWQAAISDDRILIGSEHYEAIYLFQRSGSTWRLRQKVKSRLPDADFGRSVALSGDTALAGRYGQARVLRLTDATDTSRPTTRAWAASAKSHAYVRLKYLVGDSQPTCGLASVKIRIFRASVLLRSIAAGLRDCNLRQTTRWYCPLARGGYTIKVYATDIAGNVQRKVGTATLVVK